MENEELKPCPFCGGRGLIQIAPNVRGLKKCPHCGGNGWIVSYKNCKHTEEGVKKSEAILQVQSNQAEIAMLKTWNELHQRKNRQ